MAKENGAQFPEQSDIESLIEVVKSIELNTRPQTDGKIPKTPKYEDFVKNIGNLDLIVPMGFVLLHNDLEELILLYKKTDSGNSSGVGVELNVAQSIGAIAGLAGVIGGSVIVANLTRDMNLQDVANVAMSLGDWILDKMPVITDNVAYFIETVIPAISSALSTSAKTVSKSVSEVGRNLALTALDIIDILNDESIAVQRKALLRTYISLNYAQLYGTLGYEAEIDKDGSITAITKKTEESTNYFDGLAEDAGIITIVKTGVKSLINNILNAENPGQAVGEMIGGVKAGITTAKIKAYADLVEEELPQMVLTVLNAIDLATDADLQQTSKDASKYYILAFYGNLVAQMGYLVDFENETITKAVTTEAFVSNAKTLIGDVLTGGKTLQIKSVVETLSTSLTTIMASITSLQTLGDGPSSAVKEGYGMYIKAYYANLIAKMGYSVDYSNKTLTRAVSLESLVDIAKDLTGTVLSGGVGLAIESVASSLGDSLSTIVASLTTMEMLGTDASDAVKEGYGMYTKAYYANLIAGFGYSVDYEKGTITRESSFESIKNQVINTVGDVIFAPLKMVSNAVGNSISAISSSITDAELEKELKEGVISYVNQVYLASTGMDEAIDNLKSFVVQFYAGLYDQISKKPEDFELDKNQRKVLKESFAKAMGNISTNLSDMVNTEIQNKVDVTINSVFTEERVSTLLSSVKEIKNDLYTLRLNVGANIGKNVKGIYDKIPIATQESTVPTSTETTSDMQSAGETFTSPTQKIMDTLFPK